MKSTLALIVTFLAFNLAMAADSDPVEIIRKMAAAFPKEAKPASDGKIIPISKVEFDVKKTDSLVFPLLGLIGFTVEFPEGNGSKSTLPFTFRLEYRWVDNNWIFNRVLNARGVEGGTNLITTGPIHEFIEKYQKK